MPKKDEQTFDSWCVIELMGRQKIAGLVTETTIGGIPLLRVDVPDVEGQSGHTRYFGQAAIFSITPTTEEIVLAFLRSATNRPISPYLLEDLRPQIPYFEPHDEYGEEPEEEYGDEPPF